MVGSALSLFGAIPDGIDLAAPGYVVAGVILAGAAFRTDLLSLTPTVRELGREGVLPELDIAASDDRSVVVRLADDGPGIGPQERRVIAEGRETPLTTPVASVSGRQTGSSNGTGGR